MKTVLLDSQKHDRQNFDCGVEALNNYLILMANQQSKRDNSRTFVLQDHENEQNIVGFYTLTMTQIDLCALPTKLQKKHLSSTSAGLIARLAVDKRYKGQGLGEWLLIDALKKLLQASNSVAFPVVVVDAKEGAADFYRQYGFMPFLDAGNKLFITIADVRTSFGE